MYIADIYNSDMDAVLSSFEGFQWDDGNSNKNLVKHGVQNWECEQVFFNRPLLVLDDPGHSVIEKRRVAFGKTDSNRLLAIVFTERDSLLRVISARDMNRREGAYYEKYKNQDTQV